MQFRGRSIVAGALLLAALNFIGIRRVRAQEQAPDMQMLLNLDLFSSSGADKTQAPVPGGSMLDQIRTLRQMGYLQGNAGAGQTPPSGEDDTRAPWLAPPIEEGQ